MNNDFATSYAAIIKADKQEDGSLMVYGKATDDSIDMDNQICDATWLDSAMPQWFKTGGNIREQHSNIAAGVAKEYEAKTDGHYITAHVVDPVSVKKVEAGVLKGFSIGIKAPRVVRDTKAANGRIVDGQIIEVSLVDRPANPNAKLIMAKSVEGESSLVQVEELHEYSAPLPSDIAKAAKPRKNIVEAIKAVKPDTAKFNQIAFDNARAAVAQLIQVEAQEMATGADETYSLGQLVEVANHLMAWYAGEQQEGETMSEPIEMSVEADTVKEPDTTAGCDCAGCVKCKTDGGCNSKMCKGCTKSSHMAAEKSETVDKCLDCGCHKPSETHGRTDVSTAQIVTPEQGAGSEKSADADATVEDVVAEEKTEEVAVEATEEVSADDSAEKTLLSDDTVNAIIEKAVSMVTESVKAEVGLAKAALEAAESKAASLETELAQAKSAAIGNGPKRSSIAAGKTQTDNLLVKAAEFNAKAARTTDSVLAKGYRDLANELIAKAATPSAE
jgi:predicted  nucleic acid-binding Zn-ribbon protein